MWGLGELLESHDDWATIICLVGVGQEIHDGEGTFPSGGNNGHDRQL